MFEVFDQIPAAKDAIRHADPERDYPGIELDLTVPLYDEPREGCPRGSCYEV